MQEEITSPAIFKWTKIVDGVNLTSSAESKEFPIYKISGNTVLWVDFTTVTTAGDISLTLELYNDESGTWGKYIGGNSLATISSASVSTSNAIYLKLMDYDAWAWATKAKIMFTTSAADVILNVYVGGQ